MSFVRVQPMIASWARRAEDLTHDKTDEKDAVLIARLPAQLRCYEPEPVDEIRARLRHLGIRREQLITETSSQVPPMRDLLECVWPAALDTAQQPFNASTASRPRPLASRRLISGPLSGLRRRAAGPAGSAPSLRRGRELVTERAAAGLMVQMRRGAAWVSSGITPMVVASASYRATLSASVDLGVPAWCRSASFSHDSAASSSSRRFSIWSGIWSRPPTLGVSHRRADSSGAHSWRGCG